MSATNWSHIVVADGGRVSVVPIDCDTAPGRAFYSALVLHVVLPENAVPWFQFPRFFTSHSCFPIHSNGSDA